MALLKKVMATLVVPYRRHSATEREIDGFDRSRGRGLRGSVSTVSAVERVCLGLDASADAMRSQRRDRSRGSLSHERELVSGRTQRRVSGMLEKQRSMVGACRRV